MSDFLADLIRAYAKPSSRPDFACAADPKQAKAMAAELNRFEGRENWVADGAVVRWKGRAKKDLRQGSSPYPSARRIRAAPTCLETAVGDHDPSATYFPRV